jgi:release factor glutamine methyltransferase
MTVKQAYQQLLFQLYEIYDEREAANISDMVIEKVTGFRKTARVTNKQFILSDAQIKLLNNYTSQLLQHKPVQYVLQEAWFEGIKFYVDENVLIPRPETEELVEWIIGEIKSTKYEVRNDLQIPTSNIEHRTSTCLSILDIGTGSGCIAVALKKKLSQAEIHAVDISNKALTIAKQNAAAEQTQINFHCLNILDNSEWKLLPGFDIIVSNPPYVKKSEASAMHNNVLQHEPHIALFVPDEDALIFFRTIAAFGLEHLNENGKLFFEINEALGKEVYDLLVQHHYKNIEVKKDLQGKERMVKAVV